MDQSNQIEQNSQIPPLVNMPPLPIAGKHKKKWWIIATIIVVVIALVIGALYFLPGIFSGKPNKSEISSSNDLPPLNNETRGYFTEDVNNLLKAIGINQDAFSLDDNSKSILAGVITSLDTSSTVIFNTKGYKGVEKFAKGDTYYLKPINSAIPESEYYEVIKKEIIKPEDILNGNNNPIDREVYKIFYNNYVADKPYANTVNALKVYLDKQIATKIITKYDYDEIDGSLILYYPNNDRGTQLKPSLYVKAMGQVVSSYTNPSNYLDQLLMAGKQELADGNILIINTKTVTTSTRLIDGGILQNNLRVILDDNLSKEEKLKALAGPVRYGQIQTEKTSFNLFKFNTPTTVLAASSDISELLNKSGTIVPPNKTMYIFQGPDIPGKKLGDLVEQEFSKPTGAFSTFIKNGYFSNTVQRRAFDTPTIEKFADLIKNDKATNIIFDGHGTAKGSLFMETYNMNASTTTDPEYIKNDEILRKRLKNLRDLYGADSIRCFDSVVQLSDEEMGILGFQALSGGGAWAFRDSLTKVDRIFSDVYISSNFFDNFKSNKKSLFILDACYTGQLSSVINAKVVLTAPVNSETRDSLFLSDLHKLDPYLSKIQNPGGVSFDDNKSRTYNILGGFTNGQLITNASTTSTLAERIACMNKKDTLCTVIMKGNGDNTIAISPNVKSINAGMKVEFNAPLEIENIDPANVVTIDAYQCDISQKILDKTKPKWDGDKDITLAWKGKVYRDWVEKDIGANGTPNVDYAIITVKNDQAVSKISKVKLTGNPDACTASGCLQTESWTDPAKLEYNGNKENSDFVFAMPCIQEEYYSSCETKKIVKVIDTTGEYAGFNLPASIKVGGTCYERVSPTDDQKEKAEVVTGWQDGKGCASVCVGGDDCVSNIVGFKKTEAVRSTVILPDGKIKKDKFEGVDLILNGEIVDSCRDIQITDFKKGERFYSNCIFPAAFGKHVAWIYRTSISKINADDSPTSINIYTTRDTLIYDGREIDYSEDTANFMANNGLIENIILYGDDLFYFKRASWKSEYHLMKNKQDLGVINKQNYNIDLGGGIIMTGDSRIDIGIGSSITSSGNKAFRGIENCGKKSTNDWKWYINYNGSKIYEGVFDPFDIFLNNFWHFDDRREYIIYNGERLGQVISDPIMYYNHLYFLGKDDFTSEKIFEYFDGKKYYDFPSIDSVAQNMYMCRLQAKALVVYDSPEDIKECPNEGIKYVLTPNPSGDMICTPLDIEGKGCDGVKY